MQAFEFSGGLCHTYQPMMLFALGNGRFEGNIEQAITLRCNHMASRDILSRRTRLEMLHCQRILPGLW